ncbi:hypothetical protein HNY73_013722 [Argiope bruennichi]|uniref:Uncharacterized protein n=1 Tax=Argiope bruennichi TaxID=94029 RepID=A0A8T0EQM0_ARGBR|nr:hypothetical protein HNY73_013722 [Argiope bruennichi]
MLNTSSGLKDYITAHIDEDKDSIQEFALFLPSFGFTSRIVTCMCEATSGGYTLMLIEMPRQREEEQSILNTPPFELRNLLNRNSTLHGLYRDGGRTSRPALGLTGFKSGMACLLGLPQILEAGFQFLEPGPCWILAVGFLLLILKGKA